MDLSTRQTHIIVSDTGGLYPATTLYPANDLYPEYPGEELSANIVAGTMTLEEMIVDDELIFGQLYATKFEVTLYDVEDMSGKYIVVYQEDTTDHTLKFIFTGVVDSSKKNKDGYDRQLIAYDRAHYYATKNIAEWWEQFWIDRGYNQNPDVTATILQLRTSLCSWFGIVYEQVQLPNDSIAVTKNADVSNLTFSAMLKMLCEINCCFPHFNRIGDLEFIVLDDEATPIDIEDAFEGGASTFEDYETDKITGIQFRDSSGAIKYQVGTTANLYPVSGDNILISAFGTSQLTTVGNNMLSYINNISYRPCEVKMIIGSLDYTLGKKVDAGIADFYILQNSYSNSQLIDQTMRAVGSKSIDTDKMALETSSIELNEKYSRLTFDVEQFHLEFGEYQDDVASEFKATAHGISALVSKNTIEYDEEDYSIILYGYHNPGTTEFNELEAYKASDYVNQYYLNRANGNLYRSNGSTWNYVKTLKTLETSLSSKIEVTANAITSTVARSQKEWDTTGYTINLYGYDSPAAAGYVASDYTNYYYLNQTDGKIYKSNGSSWVLQKTCESLQTALSSQIIQTAGNITSTVASTTKNWDLTDNSTDPPSIYSISYYYYGNGAPDVAASSMSNQYALNQTLGYIYKSNGSSWSFVKACNSIQAALSTEITQTVNSISLSVQDNGTGKGATFILKAGTATLSTDSITFSGLVSFTNLSTAGGTTINGSNITTGTITDDAQNPNMSINLGNGKIFAREFSLESTYLTIEEDGDMISSNKSATYYGASGSNYVYWVTGNTAYIEKGQLQINKYDSRRIVPSSITTESERKAYALNDSNYTQSSQYYGNYNYDRFINVSDGGLTFYINNKRSIYESIIKPLDSYDAGTASNKNLEIITRDLYVNRTSSARGDGTILCRSIRMWDGNDEYYYDRAGFSVNGSSSIKGDLNLNNNDLEYVKDIIMDNGSYYNGGTIHNVNNLEADGKDEMTINAEGRGLNLWGLDFLNVNGDSYNGFDGWLTSYFGSGNGLVLKNGHGCDLRFLHGILVECSEWDW